MIRKLNFNKAKLFNSPDMLVFIKPLGSMLTRVFWLPKGYPPEKEKELEEVMNTLCRIKHLGVWYFDLRDPDTRNDVKDIIVTMDIVAAYVCLDSAAELSN